jgi:hypothetical protein
LVIAFAGACVADVKSVTGIVTAVDSTSVGSVNTVTVRTAEGQTFQFDVARLDVNNGLPAAHLREHLASGIPIVVEYVIDSGRYVALRYNDASAPSG